MRTGCCEYFTSCILARSCTDCLSEVPPMRWSTKQGMNMHRKRCTGVFSSWAQNRAIVKQWSPGRVRGVMFLLVQPLTPHDLRILCSNGCSRCYV